MSEKELTLTTEEVVEIINKEFVCNDKDVHFTGKIDPVISRSVVLFLVRKLGEMEKKFEALKNGTLPRD